MSETKKTDNSPPGIEGLIKYEPEKVSIPVLEIENIIDALQAGLEHTESSLIEHDATVGRTTRRNKFWAQTLEADILALKNSIEFLKKKIVSATTNYP